MWLVFALIAMLAWGLEEVLIKVNAEKDDLYFSVKIAVCMTPFVIVVLIISTVLSESGLPLYSLLCSNVTVLLALVVYVAVMVVSYIGARYMEMSVFTPVSNASSGFAVVIILVYASLTGNYADVSVYITPASVIGMVLAVGGVIALAIVQSRMSQRTVQIGQQEKKYRVGVLALLFPLVFCLMDAVSVTIDSVNLGATGESVIGDYDYIRIYAAAYLVVSVVSWLVILAGTKKPYNPFKPFKASGYGAGLLEVIATTSYLLALGKNAVLSVPVASAYCIVTLIASRIILKEMLKLPQYVCIASVVIGVMLVSFVGL